MEEREGPGQEMTHHTNEVARRGDYALVKEGLDIKGVNDKYEFHIRRAQPQAPWTIIDVRACSRDAGLSGTGVTIALGKDTAREFLSANHVPIEELLAHPEVEIVSCSQSGDEGKRRARIDVKVKNPDAKLQNGLPISLAQATLFFAPDESGWIPTSLTVVDRTNNALTFESSNFQKVGQHVFPVTRKCILKPSKGTEWVIAQGTSEYSFEEVPLEEFYLAHYGLPEPEFGRRPSPDRLWYAVATIVLIGVMACLLVWRRSHRSTPQ
jgi:hypothetical protein